jgi:hypothetical protein
MVRRAGYDMLAGELDAALAAQKVDEVAAIAHDTAQKGRHTVTHNRGTEAVETGAIRFGLEMQQVEQDGGMAIHVLRDVAGQEIELLAFFDCFRMNPYYYYGSAEQEGAHLPRHHRGA